MRLVQSLYLKEMHKNINDKTKFSKIKLDNVKDVLYKQFIVNQFINLFWNEKVVY